MRVESRAEKYESYRFQMERLNRAMRSGFYLEAVLIEYAVAEDRLTSALVHAGVYNEKKHEHFAPKVRRLQSLCQVKGSLAGRYFSVDMLAGLEEWRKRRNDVVHRLMTEKADMAELRDVAEQGLALAKLLRNKVGSFNRALERAQNASGK